MVKTTDSKTKKKATTKKVVKKIEKKPSKTVSKSVPSKEAKKSTESFAIIQLSGVQLKVYAGKEYEVNKLEGKKGDKLDVKEVLMVSDGKTATIGKPYIDGAVVKLEITSQKKGEKIEGFVFKSKSRHRKNYGFRPSITRVIVKSI